MIYRLTLQAAAIYMMASLITPTATAQSEPSPDIQLSANVAIVTDYRFRGVSVSNEDIAIQGGLNANHSSGFYVGTWGSSIQDFNGAETELDVFGGWGGTLGSLNVNLGVTGYLYPGGENNDYYEFYSSVGGTVGIANWTVGAAYVPSQYNVSSDNIYLYSGLNVTVPDTPLTLTSLVAVEDGAFGATPSDARLHWELGASYSFKKFSLGLTYIDSDQNANTTDGTVVFSLGASFKAPVILSVFGSIFLLTYS